MPDYRITYFAEEGNTLLLTMYLFIIDQFPAMIIQADAKVGNKANQPG
jgi:hypothetical protein